MEKIDFTRHISKGFNRDLEIIFNDTNKIFNLVGKQYDNALLAFLNNDENLSRDVIANEEKVNSLECDISEECVKIFVLRQPVASDIRLVLTVSNIIKLLETISDKCVNIVKISQIKGTSSETVELNSINKLTLDVRNALDLTLNAFNQIDSLKALMAIKICFESQMNHESITRQLILDMMQDGPSFKKNLDMLWFVNLIADINDNISNIGKVIIYLIKGKDMKHSAIQEIENEVKGNNH